MINEIKKEKVIMHVDMDCFFASCLQWKYPEYRHKPIVVSYKPSKSIIVTSSYEARALGIKTAMPLYKAKELSKEVIQVDPEYSLFSELSQKTFGLIYKEFCNVLELASIDECFLDVTNFWQKYGTPKKMALAIKNRVKEVVGITCSIGISNNRFLAKTASPMNKPDGVFSLNPKNFKSYLWNKDIEDMFGVGKALEPRLKNLGIYKIGDLATMPDEVLHRNFGKYGLELKAHANGISSDVVNNEHDDYKNISNDLTLSTPVYDDEQILDTMFAIAKHVSNRAKEKRMVANTFGIIIRYKWNHEPGEKFDAVKHHRSGVNKQTTIKEFTNDVEKIYAIVKSLFLNNVDSSKGITFVSVSMKNTLKQEKIPLQINLEELNDPLIYQNKLLSLEDGNYKRLIHKGNNLEKNEGKFSEQSRYFKKDKIHFNPAAKK